ATPLPTSPTRGEVPAGGGGTLAAGHTLAGGGAAEYRSTPTPNPSPQGGGERESEGDRSIATPAPPSPLEGEGSRKGGGAPEHRSAAGGMGASAHHGFVPVLFYRAALEGA